MIGTLVATLLRPPEYCTAHIGLPMKDRRKGRIWYCNLFDAVTAPLIPTNTGEAQTD